jgi:hypothetical protein
MRKVEYARDAEDDSRAARHQKSQASPNPELRSCEPARRGLPGRRQVWINECSSQLVANLIVHNDSVRRILSCDDGA